MTITVTDCTPRVWPACLSCYNNGRLVGQWVDCAQASDVTLQQLHEGSGGPYADCEEVWCLDHENLPVPGEMGLLEAARWGEVYEEAGAREWPAVCAWVQSGSYIAQGTGDIPSLPDFQEAYQGLWDSFREHAENLADDIGLTNDWSEEAQRYFDWDAWTRDLAFDYTVMEAPARGVFVFRSL